MSRSLIPGAWCMPGLMVVLLLAGCSRRSLPPAADAETARSALKTALDAWQKGEPVGELAKRSPPLYFNEPKAAEATLLSYTLLDGHQPHGQSVHITAALTMKLKDGSTREKAVRYLVDTSPAVVIVPD